MVRQDTGGLEDVSCLSRMHGPDKCRVRAQGTGGTVGPRQLWGAAGLNGAASEPRRVPRAIGLMDMVVISAWRAWGTPCVQMQPWKVPLNRGAGRF